MLFRSIEAGLACSEIVIPDADADTGVPRNSYVEFMHGIYKYFKAPFNRTFGTGVNETVDESVWQRWRIDSSYRPPTLVRALAGAVLMLPVAVTEPLPASIDLAMSDQDA